jgi:putative acetyltransferase
MTPPGRPPTIRPYQPNDAAPTLAVFLDAVTVTAAGDYSPAQIAAWSAPEQRDLAQWDLSRSELGTVVAVLDGEIAGFSDVDSTGYIHMLFVAARFGRRGVACSLLADVERRALDRATGSLSTNASITARPFFERFGFVVLAEQYPVTRGVRLTNYRMEKRLDGPAVGSAGQSTTAATASISTS